MTITPDEISRYTQQLKLKEIGLAGQEKLKHTRVLCIGAGGLGSPLLLYLAAAGVGTLGIVDDDKLELNNLQRQILYQSNQLNQQKVVLAKQQLIALNPTIAVNIYPEKSKRENAQALISQYDIVADCTDNFDTRYLINDVCVFLKKPYVFASVSQYQGQCALFVPERTACFRCVFPTIPKNNPFANCEEGGVLGVLPGLMGVIQATEILKWILGLDTGLVNSLLVVNILNMDFKKYQLSKNPNCRICVSHEPLELFMQDIRTEENNHEISVEELRSQLNRGEDIFLLDVRTPEEYMQDNLGGVLIPLAELPYRLSELDPAKPIVIHCHMDGRSQQAMHLLLQNNFSLVKFLRGGIVEWRKN